MRIVKSGALLALAFLAVAVVRGQQPAPVVFEGGRLIIGDGRVIENGTLVVTNGRITAVGAAGQVQRPAGATRVDLAGKTVMPTLIDAHIHMAYENMNSWLADNYTRENVIDTLNRLAYYGVGATFSTGTDPIDMALQIQADQAAGKIGGARFVIAPGFGPPGAGPNGNLLRELAKFKEVVVRGVSTDAEARQGVREIAAKKIPFIKVWVTNRNGSQQKIVPEAYRALIDEAHKNNMRVVGHVTDGLADAKDLARAGLDGYIHGVTDADAEFAALMKKNDAFMTPNQGGGWRNAPGQPAWFEDPFFQEATPPATIERYRQQDAKRKPDAPDAASAFKERTDRSSRMVKVLLDGGVRIAIGTDAGAGPDYPPGWPTHRELEVLNKLGMTPQQLITAATKSSAEALRLDKDLGTLEVGKVASLLVLNANPLDNILNTRKIASVYIQGKEVDRTGLRRTWNPRATQ